MPFLLPLILCHLIWVGGSNLVFRMWPSCPPKLDLAPHFLKIVVDVKALGPPHVLRLSLWVSKGILPIKHSLQQILHLCQLNVMEIIRLSQSRAKSGHPQLLGIIPDLQQ